MSVTLDTNRAELLLLPVILLVAVVFATVVVQQLWVAALVATGLVVVYLRSRTLERSDKTKLSTLIRDALIAPTGHQAGQGAQAGTAI